MISNDKHSSAFACAALLAMACTVGSARAQPEFSEAESDAQEWKFDVFLDDSKIGYHNYRLSGDDDQQELVTEADFKVKFLFVTAYQYRHENTEYWQDGCLQQIDSRTNTNGKSVSVDGQRSVDGFDVTATAVTDRLPACVKTFAYWDVGILDELQLLNSQTGEYLAVDVEQVGSEIITVRGNPTPAQRYRLRAPNLDLDLWYSPDGDWLGLQSTVKKGRKLRYELV